MSKVSPYTSGSICCLSIGVIVDPLDHFHADVKLIDNREQQWISVFFNYCHNTHLLRWKPLPSCMFIPSFRSYIPEILLE